jgi:L-gulono-1,4-lactone dehydrogenase
MRAVGPDPGQDIVWAVQGALRSLKEDPEAETPRKRLERALEDHPGAVFAVLREEAAKSKRGPATQGLAVRLPGEEADWANCVGEQRCTPLKKLRPQTLADVVAIVKDAAANRQRVRAVGSGHAFADVARTDGAVLVNPVLLNDVREVDEATLKDAGAWKGDRRLVYAESGVVLRQLREELDNRGLALINMGGYDGQTLAGTLSTGTHGSGITFGPLASFARAIILVTEQGVVLQLEPTAGLTDPAKFSGVIDGVPVTLKQDDDYFHAAQVAMGCLGVIAGYIIEVTPAFSISERRTSTTWAQVRELLLPALWAPVAPAVASVDHFELVLSPYSRWFRHACVKVERTRLVGQVAQSGQRKDWFEALLEQASINSAPDLINLLNSLPFVSPLVIDQAIMTLVYEGAYVDKSYNVFSLGAANEIKAMAIELHCDARECVPTIDKLLDVFGEEARKSLWYMAGPLGIRFTAAADAYLAPQAGRLTCTIELDMLVGVTTGRELARRVKEKMCSSDTRSVRVHWGLDLDFVTGDDIRAWYPDFKRWERVYRELNSTGMFSNHFTDRAGISV